MTGVSFSSEAEYYLFASMFKTFPVPHTRTVCHIK